MIKPTSWRSLRTAHTEKIIGGTPRRSCDWSQAEDLTSAVFFGSVGVMFDWAEKVVILNPDAGG